MPKHTYTLPTSYQLTVLPPWAFTVTDPLMWNSLPKLYATLLKALMQSTRVYSALEALVMMLYVHLRFTLHYIICVISVAPLTYN